MKTINRSTAILTEFGAHLKPQIEVELGETFAIESKDNWWDMLGDPNSRPEPDAPPVKALQTVRVNPVAGPVAIKGVEAGDTLIIDLKEINIRDWGWTGTTRNFGQLSTLATFAEVNENFSTVIRHQPGPSGTLDDGTAVMNITKPYRWPLAPFLGFIATAPERGIENTVTSQGPWGGNIDVRDLRVGNRVMMNASHAGGLLFVGDVHASQADSELTGVANETAATVVASADVIKGRQIPGVMRIETPTALIQVDSARLSGNQDRALQNSFENMVNWLCEDYGVSRREAYLMMSVNSLVRVNVYQYVCGNFVCGVEFPKATLGL